MHAIDSPRRRARLASALEAAVEKAEHPAPAVSSAVPVRRTAVRGARSELLDLAERLRQPRPVDPAGVRLARELLTDGASPLYVGNGDTVQLREWARHALRTLDGDGGSR
jgi:hypothetical protein